jgi:DNA polymerase epsilon subunit 3
MPRKETATAPITAESQQSAVSEGIDAFELPKSLVTKLAKAAIPEQSRVQKEAILALMKGSTVFINLLGTFFSYLLCTVLTQ